jgi:hypothetical protein
VIDCTGHGVPGAFMTLIALSWLEQRSQQLVAGGDVSPDALLGELNRYIKHVLDQRGLGRHRPFSTREKAKATTAWTSPFSGYPKAQRNSISPART